MPTSSANTPDFIATYWTHAGNVVPLGAPEQEASPHDFRLRAEAAASAGFRGIGLMHSDLMQIRRDYNFADLKSLLADNGLKHLEFEFLVDWLEDGEALAASEQIFGDLLEAAEALGARHIKIGPDMAGKAWPLPHMVERFRKLCARAAAVGTSIVIEIMPWANLKTVADGVALVEAANCPNGGLLIDIWHIARGNISYEDVANIPRGLIHHVELSDAAADIVGTLIEDTLARRLHCGQGAFEVSRFIQALDRQGYDGPVGIEIISARERQRALADVLQDAHRYTQEQYAIARA